MERTRRERPRMRRALDARDPLTSVGGRGHYHAPVREALTNRLHERHEVAVARDDPRHVQAVVAGVVEELRRDIHVGAFLLATDGDCVHSRRLNDPDRRTTGSRIVASAASTHAPSG